MFKYSFVAPVGAFSVAVKLTEEEPPLVTDSPDHVMVFPDCTPPLFMVAMVYPEGTTSARFTPVASFAPPLETSSVKVTVSPTLAMVGSTVLSRLRSAD